MDLFKLCILSIIASMYACQAVTITKADLGVTYHELGYLNQGVIHHYLVFGLEVPKVMIPKFNESAVTLDCHAPRIADEWKSLYELTCLDVLTELKNLVMYINDYRSEIVDMFDNKIMSIVEQYHSYKFQGVKHDDSNLHARKRRALNQATSQVYDLIQGMDQHTQKALDMFDKIEHKLRELEATIPKDDTRDSQQIHTAIKSLRQANQDLRQKFEHVKSIHKRFVFQLAETILGIANTAISAHKEIMMDKAIKAIQSNIWTIYGKVKHLQDGLVSVTKTIARGFRITQEAISHVEHSMNRQYREFSQRFIDSRQAAGQFWNLNTFVLSRTMNLLGQQLTLFQDMRSEGKGFMSALDALSTGHLSHEIIPPYELNLMVEQVRKEMNIRHPDLEVVLKGINEYYDLPLIDYTYMGNRTIAVMVPILLKAKQLPPMKIYKIDTNFVPYNMVQKDLEAPENSFTKVEMEADMIAVEDKGFHSITMDTSDLDQCFKMHNQYYCGTGFLNQYKGRQSCEVAVFRDETAEVLKELCEFRYYYNIKPRPQVITTATEVLIANLPLPWIFQCEDGYDIANVLSGPSYAMLRRDIFCKCGLEAEKYNIYASPLNCVESPMPEPITYQVNGALYLAFGRKIPMSESKWREEPLREYFPNPEIDGKHQEVLEDCEPDDKALQHSGHVFQLAEVAESLEKEEAIINAGPGINPVAIPSWFNGENDGMVMLFSGFIVTIFCVLVIIVIVVLVYKNKEKLKAMRRSLLPMYPILETMGKLPQASGQRASGKPEPVIEIQWVDIVAICLMQLVAILLVYALYRFIKYWVLRMRLVMWDGDDKQWGSSHFYLQLSSKMLGYERLYMGTGIAYPNEYAVWGKLKYTNLAFQGGYIDSYIRLCWFNNCELYRGNEEIQPDVYVNIPILKRNRVQNLLTDTDLDVSLVVRYDDQFWNLKQLEVRPNTAITDGTMDDIDGITQEQSAHKSRVRLLEPMIRFLSGNQDTEQDAQDEEANTDNPDPDSSNKQAKFELDVRKYFLTVANEATPMEGNDSESGDSFEGVQLDDIPQAFICSFGTQYPVEHCPVCSKNPGVLFHPGPIVRGQRRKWVSLCPNRYRFDRDKCPRCKDKDPQKTGFWHPLTSWSREGDDLQFDLELDQDERTEPDGTSQMEDLGFYTQTRYVEGGLFGTIPIPCPFIYTKKSEDCDYCVDNDELYHTVAPGYDFTQDQLCHNRHMVAHKKNCSSCFDTKGIIHPRDYNGIQDCWNPPSLCPNIYDKSIDECSICGDNPSLNHYPDSNPSDSHDNIERCPFSNQVSRSDCPICDGMLSSDTGYYHSDYITEVAGRSKPPCPNSGRCHKYECWLCKYETGRYRHLDQRPDKYPEDQMFVTVQSQTQPMEPVGMAGTLGDPWVHIVPVCRYSEHLLRVNCPDCKGKGPMEQFHGIGATVGKFSAYNENTTLKSQKFLLGSLEDKDHEWITLPVCPFSAVINKGNCPNCMNQFPEEAGLYHSGLQGYPIYKVTQAVFDRFSANRMPVRIKDNQNRCTNHGARFCSICKDKEVLEFQTVVYRCPYHSDLFCPWCPRRKDLIKYKTRELKPKMNPQDPRIVIYGEEHLSRIEAINRIFGPNHLGYQYQVRKCGWHDTILCPCNAYKMGYKKQIKLARSDPDIIIEDEPELTEKQILNKVDVLVSLETKHITSYPSKPHIPFFETNKEEAPEASSQYDEPPKPEMIPLAHYGSKEVQDYLTLHKDSDSGIDFFIHPVGIQTAFYRCLFHNELLCPFCETKDYGYISQVYRRKWKSTDKNVVILNDFDIDEGHTEEEAAKKIWGTVGYWHQYLVYKCPKHDTYCCECYNYRIPYSKNYRTSLDDPEVVLLEEEHLNPKQVKARIAELSQMEFDRSQTKVKYNSLSVALNTRRLDTTTDSVDGNPRRRTELMGLKEYLIGINQHSDPEDQVITDISKLYPEKKDMPLCKYIDDYRKFDCPVCQNRPSSITGVRHPYVDKWTDPCDVEDTDDEFEETIKRVQEFVELRAEKTKQSKVIRKELREYLNLPEFSDSDSDSETEETLV